MMAKTGHARTFSVRPRNLPRANVSLSRRFAALSSAKPQKPFLHNEVAYGQH